MWEAPHARPLACSGGDAVPAPESGPHPGVILLGGSDGGMHEPNAALLASYDYAVLALACFGMEGVPPSSWTFRWSTSRRLSIGCWHRWACVADRL